MVMISHFLRISLIGSHPKRSKIFLNLVCRAFDQPEIIGNVLVKILGNNLRVGGRYGFGSVDVGVEAGKVHVPDLFVSLATTVQFGRIGSAAVQGMMSV